MEALSPAVECPPTDVFQFRFTTYSQARSAQNLLPEDNSDLACKCIHSSGRTTALSSVTPTPKASSIEKAFNKVTVCWECESDCPTQQSPLYRRSRPSLRFSSLKANARRSTEDPPVCERPRHASTGFFPSFYLEPSTVRKVSIAPKQENMPYSFMLPIRTLTQLDGPSNDDDDDDDEQRPCTSSLIASPWSDATADTPSKDSPPSDKANTSPLTPPTSPNITMHPQNSLEGSIDLMLPNRSALQDPFDLFSDATTPLTLASPAVGAFPCPLERRSTSSLTPLTPRTGGSPLRPSQRPSALNSHSGSYTPSRRPDRFISAHKTSQSPRESFQISKSADKLVGIERTLRTNSGGPDPFSRYIPRTPPRTTSRPRPPVTLPRTGSGGPHNVLGVRRASMTAVNRQVSSGAVWTVGGMGALGDSVAGVSDGQSGLLASGTNARLHSSKFLARIDSIGELEVHERRLALALDLDPASRILTYQTSGKATRSSPTHSSFSSSPDQINRNSIGSRVWLNNEWVKEGSVARLFWSSVYLHHKLIAYTGLKKSNKRKKAVPIIPFR
jgi:hypothetical protein